MSVSGGAKSVLAEPAWCGGNLLAAGNAAVSGGTGNRDERWRGSGILGGPNAS